MRYFAAAALIVSLFALTACYTPLYGAKGLSATTQEQSLNDIFIGAIDGENGQKLRNLLIDRMYYNGRPAKASRNLEVTLTVVEEHLGLQKDAVTTRARLNVNAEYKLSVASLGKVLLADKTRSIVSFDILTQDYATLASRENAYDRALKEVADRITTRVLLYFHDNGPSNDIAVAPMNVVPAQTAPKPEPNLATPPEKTMPEVTDDGIYKKVTTP
jgi:hypothetical protein